MKQEVCIVQCTDNTGDENVQSRLISCRHVFTNNQTENIGFEWNKKRTFKAKLFSLGNNMAHLGLYLAVINCYFFNYLQSQFTCVVLPQPVSPLTSVTWFCDTVVIISCLMLSTGSIFCRICDCTRRGGIWGNPLFSLPVVILLTSVISIWIYT